MNTAYNTSFAPARRTPANEILEHYLMFDSNESISKALNSIHNIVLVLNADRQIVFVNKSLLDALELDDMTKIIGQRPGELFNCIHGSETEGGCGTTESCRYCGAVLAILASQTGVSDTRECRINTSKGDNTEALDLRVHASPVELDGQSFTFFSIMDISSDKRRQVLERIFFHDVLNTASALKVTIDLLNMDRGKTDRGELISMLPIVSQKLINEVRSQQELLKAERGELLVENKDISSLKVLQELVSEYKYANLVDDRFIEVSPDAVDTIINTDETLLKRVLSNMLKNALEASSANDKIVVGNKLDSEESIIFYVQNPECMTDEVRLQIFNRSFSTKGIGRGLGTYSIKLLTERYLKGTVGFTTDKENGTVFWVKIKQ
jgi:signal transduction histidine kinase